MYTYQPTNAQSLGHIRERRRGTGDKELERAMTRRRQLVGPICVGLGVGALALVFAHLSVSRRIDEAIAEAASPRGEMRVELLTAHRFPHDAQERLWTNTQSTTDGCMLGDHLHIATSGGLVEIAGASTNVRTSMSDAGLADHDLTAVVSRAGGGASALGTRSGVVAVIESSSVRSVRIDDGRRGGVVDLVWADSGIIVATTSGALIRLDADLGSASLIEPVVEGGLAALAQSSDGLLVAGGDSAVYRVEGDRMVPIMVPTEGRQIRLTALAYRDHRLLLGSPTGLLTSPVEGRLEPLREGIFVTSILTQGELVYVGTFDQGVLVLDAARLSGTPVRRLLPGRRIHRLRLVDGQPMAFGTGFAARLDATLGVVQELELPRGIASNHVSSLALDDRHRLWVGHFSDGIDVLDGDELLRRLPGRELAHLSNVNAMAFDGVTHSMLVATSRGVLEVSESETDVLDSDDGLIGHNVTALLVGDDERVFATNRGLTVATRSGGEVRSLYAFHGLPSNRLYALARAVDGVVGDGEAALVVGTLGGVALLDGLRVTKTIRAMAGGLRANWCSALAATAEGIYVGTTGGGVDLWRSDGRVEGIALPGGGQATVNPGAMLVVGDSLLVGTAERGILVYDRRRREWVELERSMLDVSVTAFALDDRSLYVGTDRGLLRLRREWIDEV